MTSILGLRYVKPLFQLAKEKDLLDPVESGITAFSSLMKETPELESALLNPQVPVEKKKQILLKVLGEDCTPLLRDFLSLLMDKGREKVLIYLEQEFNRLLRESRNMISATVQTPVSLGDDFKAELTQRFAEVTGKKVELSEELRPELIAGMRILMGSSMMDGSLKARLDGMKRHLNQVSRVRAD